MARDQDAVAGRHEIGLDEVRPLLDGELVGFQRVLGQIPARAAVPDHKRAFAGQRPRRGLGQNRVSHTAQSRRGDRRRQKTAHPHQRPSHRESVGPARRQSHTGGAS
jgi:hypothetical protein